MRRCCRTSASGSRSGRRSASRAWAAPANHSSGDLFLAFATGNRGLATTDEPGAAAPVTHDVRMVLDNRMTPLFKATVEATEAAVVNALLQPTR